MKVMVSFDATVGSYDIKSQLFMIRSLKGVKSVELLLRQQGDAPQYCLDIEADDEALSDLSSQVDAIRGQFTGFISNVKLAAFAKA